MRINITITLMLIAVLSVAQSTPNVVVLLFDDMGKETVTATAVKDENGTSRAVDLQYLRDSLPVRGLTFTNGFSTPICTPSRVSLLTGRYSYKSYHGFKIMHPDDRTTGLNARWAGWNTAILGKWQLDRSDNHPSVSTVAQTDSFPYKMGFDYWMCFYTDLDDDNVRRYSDCRLNINEVNTTYGTSGYCPDIQLDTLFELIDRFSAQDKPYYIQYMESLPHDPFEPPSSHSSFPDFQAAAPGDSQYFPAMCEYADSIAWLIYKKLYDEGHLENTILIVASDNGNPINPHTPNPMRTVQPGGGEIPHRKTYNDYYGTNVPFYVFYEGGDKSFANGDTSTALVQLEDIYATIAELTGNHWHDGKSLMQYVATGYTSDPRGVVVSWYNTYWDIGAGTSAPKSIFHNAQYGYVKEDDEWFNLASDPMLTTPISQPGGTDYILTEAALHPTVTFVYPDVMKELLTE